MGDDRNHLHSVGARSLTRTLGLSIFHRRASVANMTARGFGRTAARVARSITPSAVTTRAADFARNLKAEYEAGKADAAAEPDEATEQAEAESVAEAMRGIDWAKVRAATGARSAHATQAMKSMADEVDWARVQPVAAKVSSALIAAVASGQLSVGGRMGGTVARAIMNDQNLAQRVSTTLARQQAPMPPDFRPLIAGAIEATSSE